MEIAGGAAEAKHPGDCQERSQMFEFHMDI
jgi:hypothetical protein